MTDLPKNLAKPHDPERAHFWANVIVGGALMLICAGMLAYAALLR
jgi:hypothetical protein